ncbi:MAG: tRNA pseudouridine(38-40) synthase TruA [Deltaproteobacteria bacterium]|nr:MAG: tRNA pseudouridine(38-40) synthase TruA [Deltaproteobacteria bacterium]
MRTIKLVVEYDGTDLAGWQRQANGPTVQEHLERALAAMTGGPVAVIGASRTDAGVHALGQVAHFRTGAAIPEHGFRRGLNALLPPAIAVVGCERAPDDFHARFWALGKHYRYRVLARPDRSPLWRRTAWHRPRPLDVDAMRAAAAHLVGEHDFSAFRAAGCTARTATRRVTAIDIDRTGDLVDIHVRGDAFLRNMVRIIAGTLVEVGEGRRAPEAVADALGSRDRTRAGQTAPARGLTLVSVAYGDGRPPDRGVRRAP